MSTCVCVKSASLKKLKIVKTSNLMHSAWTKVA